MRHPSGKNDGHALALWPPAADTTILPSSLRDSGQSSAGVGMLLTIVVSPIFTALSGSFGMAMAFCIFFLVMIIGVISVISEKETGRKPQAA